MEYTTPTHDYAGCRVIVQEGHISILCRGGGYSHTKKKEKKIVLPDNLER